MSEHFGAWASGLLLYLACWASDLKMLAEAVFCAADVKRCPDGSYVSRVPPTCEFKECPN